MNLNSMATPENINNNGDILDGYYLKWFSGNH